MRRRPALSLASGEAPRTRARRETPEDRPARVRRRDRTAEENDSRRDRHRAAQEEQRLGRRPGVRDSSTAGVVPGAGTLLGQQARTRLSNGEATPVPPETEDSPTNEDPMTPAVTEDPDPTLDGDTEVESPEQTAGVAVPDDEDTAAEVRPDVNENVGEPAQFADVGDDHWARSYIDAMSARGLIQGVEGDRFAPDEPVTRAQYAQLVQQVFASDEDVRESLAFVDVDEENWAASAIDSSVRWGFLSGYPGLQFRPEQSISRLEVLLSLRAGLNLSEPEDPEPILEAFGDRDQIPNWARPPVSAAVQAELERNRPDAQGLDLDREATRAEVTAMFYQALVRAGYAEPIP